MTNDKKSSDPLDLTNMKSVFILTDLIIPIVSAGIAAWVGLDLLDKFDKISKNIDSLQSTSMKEDKNREDLFVQINLLKGGVMEGYQEVSNRCALIEKELIQDLEGKVGINFIEPKITTPDLLYSGSSPE